MITYDSVAIIDWNAGNDTGPTPRKDAIWVAVASRDHAEEPVYLRNRVVAFEWLTALIEREMTAGRKLLIGFDFPFGYPEHFAAAITSSFAPMALWDFYAEALEDTPRRNNRFDLAGELNARFPGVGPFWFNGLKRDIPNLPRTRKERTKDHGQKERRVTDSKHRGTFTVWQMGGAGAVGGQTMTGMAALSRLRAAYPGEIAVFPFDIKPAPVTIAEVWPTVIDPAVHLSDDPIRDSAQVRLLAQSLARLPSDTFNRMLAVDAPVEGWILGTGYERELLEHAWPS